MRNWYDTGCDCSNPEPIVGAIVGGKKFPFGTVKQSEYDADMKEVHEDITALNNQIASLSSAHAADVTVINHKIDDANERINVLNNSISKLASSVEALSDKIRSYDSEINALKVSAGNADASIKSLADTAENLNARVKALEEGPQPEPPAPVEKFYVYWGPSAASAPTTSVITGLAYKTYTDTTTRVITVPCNDEYCYYAIPESKGTVQFEVSGFTGGFTGPFTVPVMDAEGNTTNYNVYRSNQKLKGTAPIKVKK